MFTASPGKLGLNASSSQNPLYVKSFVMLLQIVLRSQGGGKLKALLGTLLSSIRHKQPVVVEDAVGAQSQFSYLVEWLGTKLGESDQ